ncbi:MAG: hypothetical protein A3K19_03420 [Lentisphaerae bacterium RIFOXYB12_FULL_65_16]|nr:MAG: hypothetical protein A3K19_03420 [Lentisphaerae bacterium RIFOXYB12_FULL_65_16]
MRHLLALICLLAAMPGHGQTVTQQVTLNPGWNAVYLEVQPDPADVATVFNGVAVASVWTWSSRVTAAEFVQDLSETAWTKSKWLRWFPLTQPQAFMNNLYALQAHRSYFIKLDGVAPAVVSITGKPSVSTLEWNPDAYNLVGLPVDPDAPPTFQEFFAASPAHAGQDIYRLNAGGSWELVANPGTQTAAAGQAYWVFCDGGSSYAGTLSVTAARGGGLDYGRSVSSHDLTLDNLDATAKDVTITVLSNAADGVLVYQDYNTDTKAFEWLPLPEVFEASVAADKKKILSLGARRASIPAGQDLWTTVLDIRDDAGMRALVPVSVEQLRDEGVAGEGRAEPDAHAGLWVGLVTVNQVSQANPPAADLSFDLELAGTVEAPLNFVTFGAEWRYSDTGTDLGTAWRAASYDASAWPKGKAQFGYGALFPQRGSGEEIWKDNGALPLRYTQGDDTELFYGHLDSTWNTANETAGLDPNPDVYYTDTDGSTTYTTGEDLWKDMNGNAQYDAGTDIRISDGGNGWETATGTAGRKNQILYSDADANSSYSISMATVLSYGADPNNKRNTYYFRTTFINDGVFTFESLRVKLRRDAGAVVYLNDVEIVSSNMPYGAIGYATRASSSVTRDSAAEYVTEYVSANPLAKGVNTLAVEVHRYDATGPDLSFDLELDGILSEKEVLSPAGVAWKYPSAGTNLDGSGWQQSAYDDSGWYAYDHADNHGAQYGYGDGDEATVLTAGPDDARFPTFYFRRQFSVANAAAYTGLQVRVLRDDGAVVYLNGAEIARSNMPEGEAITYTSKPVTIVAGEEEDLYQVVDLGAAGLVDGVNVLAVEVHQNAIECEDRNPLVPTPTASEFTFPILLHVDNDGAVRLLKEVTQMWQDGTLKADPENPGKYVVDEPGRYVLVTDDSKLGDFQGATMRDGVGVGRRLSSAAFDFDGQYVGLSGTFAVPNTLTCSLALPADFPTNPFKHKYHPDHDNLDGQFNPLPGGQAEAYDITRQLALTFTATDPLGHANVDYGKTAIGGTYAETLTGLHKNQIKVTGHFRLHLIAKTGVLNE